MSSPSRVTGAWALTTEPVRIDPGQVVLPMDFSTVTPLSMRAVFPNST